MKDKNDKPEKLFGNTFVDLCSSHNSWSVWCDFITISAIAIVNSVDHSERRSDREKEYFSITSNYSAEELSKFASMLGYLTMILDNNPVQDFLGEFYMQHKFGNGNKGQFFTPWYVADFMTKIVVDEKKLLKDIDNNLYASVYDPACGSGVMLLAFANTVKNNYEVNYQQSIIFVAQDIDPIVAKMCYIQLSLIGCPGYVVIGNSLTEPIEGHLLFPIEHDNIWFTPLWYLPKWDMVRGLAVVKESVGESFKESKSVSISNGSVELIRPRLEYMATKLKSRQYTPSPRLAELTSKSRKRSSIGEQLKKLWR